MPNLTHLLIICRSPEHRHKGSLLASNQKADEIGELPGARFLYQANISCIPTEIL